MTGDFAMGGEDMEAISLIQGLKDRQSKNLARF